MSYFGITAEKIATVKHHPNADRLDICTLVGMTFQFVTGRDQYKPGEMILYFPVDSILPLELQGKMGVTGMLSGKNKDRVKTVRLRGEISQGLVGPQSLAAACAAVSDDVCMTKSQWGVEIANWLGVTKYEPEAIETKAGKLFPLPCGLGVYDIEGAERNMDAVSRLMLEQVVVTEKLEGQNFSVSYEPIEGRVYVNQRKFTIEPIEGNEHYLWKLARNAHMISTGGPDFSFLGFLTDVYPSQRITVYGEAYGPKIQGNIYNVDRPQVRLFDIKVGWEFLDFPTFIGLVHMYFRIDYKFQPTNHVTVPILFTGMLTEWLEGRTIAEASSGPSCLNSNVLREGVVIRPFIEQRHPEIGRLIIKQRDPVYLVNEK